MSDGGENPLDIYRDNAGKILSAKTKEDPEAALLTEALVEKMTKAQLVNQMIILARFARRNIDSGWNRARELEDIIDRGIGAEKRHVERIQELSTQLHEKQQKYDRVWQEVVELRSENARLDLLSEKRLSRKMSRKAGELWSKLDDKTQQP